MRIVLSALVLLSFFACSGDDEAPGGNTIGPEGGEVSSADGKLKLTVPPGALSKEVTFGLSRATDPAAQAVLSAWTEQTGGNVDATAGTVSVDVLHTSCWTVIATDQNGPRVVTTYEIVPHDTEFSIPAGLVFTVTIDDAEYAVYYAEGECTTTTAGDGGIVGPVPDASTGDDSGVSPGDAGATDGTVGSPDAGTTSSDAGSPDATTGPGDAGTTGDAATTGDGGTAPAAFFQGFIFTNPARCALENVIVEEYGNPSNSTLSDVSGNVDLTVPANTDVIIRVDGASAGAGCYSTLVAVNLDPGPNVQVRLDVIHPSSTTNGPLMGLSPSDALFVITFYAPYITATGSESGVLQSPTATPYTYDPNANGGLGDWLNQTTLAAGNETLAAHAIYYPGIDPATGPAVFTVGPPSGSPTCIEPMGTTQVPLAAGTMSVVRAQCTP